MADGKLRLSALPEDVERRCDVLRESDQVVVLEESEAYPNRGKSVLVRRYVTVEVRQPSLPLYDKS